MIHADVAPHVRSLLVSDVHLGSHRCQARALHDLLTATKPETLLLVGDTIDLWSVRAGMRWPATHTAILLRLCELLARGTRVVLLPGNHDETLLELPELSLPGMEMRRDFVLETRMGGRFLVVHGHEQDVMFGATHAVARVAYGVTEHLSSLTRVVSGSIRLPLLARRRTAHRQTRLHRTVRRSARFELAVTREARRRGLDGVICGHTHAPADREIAGIRYLNCGDWIKSCTAVVETSAGELQLVRWPPGTRAGIHHTGRAASDGARAP
ncbi:MAG: UDP-2,3-diacylglucosamine diphosphatase [Hyphomicrobiaceae bacterium]|nr:UDP-2,3-diacylglucosamine diphosphatase [Hyphomicrobiaceae bacterium]